MRSGHSLSLDFRAFTPERWGDLERLFGPNGACGGCWCMFWRQAKGEKWDRLKGAPAKRRLKALAARGALQGILAYADGEPVGWCNFGPRLDFAKLNRAPTLACDDADRVWSVPCFYIRRDCRSRGVATALLREACRVMKARGARVVEGYPLRPSPDGRPLPAAFAWTGTVPQFARLGFADVGRPGASKRRMRKKL